MSEMPKPAGHSSLKSVVFSQMSTFMRVCVLFTFFFIGLFINFAITAVGDLSSSRTGLLFSAIVQDIVVFALPAVCAAWLLSDRPGRWLGTSSAPSPKSIIAALLIFILAIPALNQVIFWNEHLTLPNSMADVYNLFRSSENAALAVTNTMLATDSIGGLIVNILVIGCGAGIAEELFFRAGLQKILCGGMNRHAAVWTAAIVFSLLHFQFFGFVPRVLLGAFFGYLYLWSDSLWLNAGFHALNNSIVVVTAWVATRSGNELNPEMWGVSDGGFPFIALGSALLTAGFIILCRRTFFDRKEVSHG